MDLTVLFVLGCLTISNGMEIAPDQEVQCRQVECAPKCTPEQDSDGCQQCVCPPKPSDQEVAPGKSGDKDCPGGCAEGNVCNRTSGMCEVDGGPAGMFFIAKRSACSPVICTLACPFGFKKNNEGCSICSCNEEDKCPLMFCPGKCFQSRCLPVEKPGLCPKPGIGICVERCSSDDSCPDNQKCCSNGCGHVCTIPVSLPREKPGFCPKPGIGICVELCSSDATCPDNKKCCSNGCGHVCTIPVNEKPGICPKLRKSKECIRGCAFDGSCPNDLKCCKQCCKKGGCGGRCVKPLPCELDSKWTGSVKAGKQRCNKCTCQEILNVSKKLMRKACRKKRARLACCPLCKLANNK